MVVVSLSLPWIWRTFTAGNLFHAFRRTHRSRRHTCPVILYILSYFQLFTTTPSFLVLNMANDSLDYGADSLPTTKSNVFDRKEIQGWFRTAGTRTTAPLREVS